MKKLNKKLKVIVFCTVQSGLDAVAEVLSQGHTIEGIVALDPDNANYEKVSGFCNVKVFCERQGVRFFPVKTYSLTDEEDLSMISQIKYDLIWIAGWQRLIPNSILQTAQYGAVGIHGSPDGISGGRGRSPQNWALMLGCEKFELALFSLTPDVDDGPILVERTFVISEFDDIESSYKKASLLTGEMVSEILNNPSLLGYPKVQIEDGRYYPQRLPIDGFIDWNQKKREIFAYCRALTRPYPGARTVCGAEELIIWRCVPFDDKVRSAPGQIDAVFEDQKFIVSCSDGRILIQDYYSASWVPKIGAKFNSVPIKETMKTIIERHKQKAPDKKLSRRITNYG